MGSVFQFNENTALQNPNQRAHVSGCVRENATGFRRLAAAVTTATQSVVYSFNFTFCCPLKRSLHHLKLPTLYAALCLEEVCVRRYGITINTFN